ncbi:MAG: NADH-quinone oxidoreductase subunit C, partial [candidate division Zixibacteria bacterium]|nr:NADH-quinone oxidoreductase subunit C [candidate division Zixibacteria bacterium]
MADDSKTNLPPPESWHQAPSDLLWTTNDFAVALKDIPTVPDDRFKQICVSTVSRGARLSALLVLPSDSAATNKSSSVLAVLADDTRGRIGLVCMAVPKSNSFESLSDVLPQAQAFEREIFESHAIRPDGHPWLKPLRAHAELTPAGNGDASQVPKHPFFQVAGEGIHEVA